MRVLGVCGSLRTGSFNAQLLLAAARHLPPMVTLETYDGMAEVPPFSEDLPRPRVVERLRDGIRAADGVLVATPEHNGSIPGHLKNVLDWVSTPFADNVLRGKPVAVVGATTGGFGAVWARAELRKVLATIGARVLDAELGIPYVHDAFLGRGMLADPHTDARLEDVVAELVRRARERSCRSCGDGSMANAG